MPSTTRILFDQAEAVLAPLYGEPHRHYHTLTHIDGMLLGLDACLHQARQPDLIRLAIWFHDAIYDPTQQDNEEQSALLAERSLREWGAEESLIRRVAAMVRATARHEWLDGEPDTALFLDLDLGILAAPPDSSDRYAKQVAQEYAWVPPELYRAGRIKVLQGFLNRPTIFFTPALAEQLDAWARQNLHRELASLISAS